MSDKFRVRYEIDDGYIGKSRPQHFHIDESEIEEDMNEEDLKLLYGNAVNDDFDTKIHPFGKNIDEFVEWAKNVISARSD